MSRILSVVTMVGMRSSPWQKPYVFWLLFSYFLHSQPLIAPFTVFPGLFSFLDFNFTSPFNDLKKWFQLFSYMFHHFVIQTKPICEVLPLYHMSSSCSRSIISAFTFSVFARSGRHLWELPGFVHPTSMLLGLCAGHSTEMAACTGHVVSCSFAFTSSFPISLI